MNTTWLNEIRWTEDGLIPVIALPSRRTFFENLRTLLQFIHFDNWQHLMQFMLHGGIELPIET